MGITNIGGDTFQKALTRGDELFHILGTADDSFADLDIPTTINGAMIGPRSEVDSVRMNYLNPVSPLLVDSVFITPWAPLMFRVPPSAVSVTGNLLIQLSLTAVRPIEFPTLGMLSPPIVEVYVAIRGKLPVAARRNPVTRNAIGAAGGVEVALGSIYAYGRKTLFCSLFNAGATPATIRFAGVSLIAAGIAAETTLGTVVVAAGTSTVFNRSVDDSFDVFRVFATGPATDLHYRMEVRDEG